LAVEWAAKIDSESTRARRIEATIEKWAEWDADGAEMARFFAAEQLPAETRAVWEQWQDDNRAR
jgi:hypothetical protein